MITAGVVAWKKALPFLPSCLCALSVYDISKHGKSFFLMETSYTCIINKSGPIRSAAGSLPYQSAVVAFALAPGWRVGYN